MPFPEQQDEWDRSPKKTDVGAATANVCFPLFQPKSRQTAIGPLSAIILCPFFANFLSMDADGEPLS